MDGKKFLDTGKRFAVGAFAYAVGICFCVGAGVTIGAGAIVIGELGDAMERRRARKEYEKRSKQTYKEAERYDKNDDDKEL